MIIVVSFVSGLVLWTLLEYVLHRFGGHTKRLGKKVMREHLAHHATPDYFSPWQKKLLLAVPTLSALALAGALVLGLAGGIALAVGTAAGWLFYEELHRATHVRGPRNRYGEWARRHHLHHHFQSAKTNHGVTSPLWDWVFGTLERAERVAVPRRHVHAFAWLVEGTDGGEVSPRYASRYRLV